MIKVGTVRFADPRPLPHTGIGAKLQRLANPGRPLDPVITHLTGIQDADQVGQARWEAVRPQVQAFLSAPTTAFRGPQPGVRESIPGTTRRGPEPVDAAGHR